MVIVVCILSDTICKRQTWPSYRLSLSEMGAKMGANEGPFIVHTAHRLPRKEPQSHAHDTTLRRACRACETGKRANDNAIGPALYALRSQDKTLQ